MGAVGVITGSRIEAGCLDGQPNLLVTCSGAVPARARQRAERLMEDGVGGLVSFGFAGGLDPALRPGDLVVPETVLLPPSDGTRAAPPGLTPSAGWRRALLRRLARAGLRPLGGTVLGSERIIESRALKAELHGSTGAGAVDQESHVVASLGEAAGLPWLVLRCIVDPADLTLPPVLRSALGPDGAVDPSAILHGLIRQPRALLALVALGVHSRRALHELTRAGRALADCPPRAGA